MNIRTNGKPTIFLRRNPHKHWLRHYDFLRFLSYIRKTFQRDVYECAGCLCLNRKQLCYYIIYVTFTLLLLYFMFLLISIFKCLLFHLLFAILRLHLFFIFAVNRSVFLLTYLRRTKIFIWITVHTAITFDWLGFKVHSIIYWILITFTLTTMFFLFVLFLFLQNLLFWYIKTVGMTRRFWIWWLSHSMILASLLNINLGLFNTFN